MRILGRPFQTHQDILTLIYSLKVIAMLGVRCTGAAPLTLILVKLVSAAYVQIAIGLVPCARVKVYVMGVLPLTFKGCSNTIVR